MIIRLAALLFGASSFGFAGSWSGSGYLVDSNCFATAESNRNVNPTSVDRDMNAEIRECSPNSRTKNFAVVLPDWLSVRFDAAGNAKAGELVRQSTKRTEVQVAVTGDRYKGTVKVGSLSVSRASR